MDRKEFTFLATPEKGQVSAIFIRPSSPLAVLVMAHGSGAGMNHHFIEKMALALGRHQIATFRFNFPYMERGKGGLDGKATLKASIVSAVSEAKALANGLPVFAGGKSMGGRISSMLAAEGGLEQVKGLVFFGFPLHPMGKPSDARAVHLYSVPFPMLFLQGTRDKLAELALLTPVIDTLGPKAHLHIQESGDHSFKTLKRSGISEEEVLENLASATKSWIGKTIG